MLIYCDKLNNKMSNKLWSSGVSHSLRELRFILC